nr:hypothetical protein [Capsulimonas corticalis]
MEVIGIACERARLPHLIGQPIVLATADGAVRCASAEARSMGISKGLSTSTASALCQGLIVLPYDQASYAETAEAIWDVIAVETNSVEPINPELYYAEFDGPDIAGRVQHLARTIADKIGVPISVGLGSSKLVAHAAAMVKPQDRDAQVHVEVIEQSHEPYLLAQFPVDFLPGVDAKLIQRLGKLGVTTIGNIRKIPAPELERQVNKQMALKLRRLAIGEDSDPVKALWPQQKIEHRHVFDDEVRHDEIIAQALQACVVKIAFDLQRGGKYCRTVALTIKADDQSFVHENEHLYSPSHDAATLLRTANRLLARLWLQKPVVEISVAVTGIDAGGSVQLTLLDTANNSDSFAHERKISLEAEMRTLRKRYGPASVVTGSLLLKSSKLNLWTHALTKRRDERVRVSMDQYGRPLRYSRSGRSAYDGGRYEIVRVIDQWRSSTWSWGKIAEVDAFRVMTEPHGTFELHKIGDEWRLRATAD